MHTQIGLIGYGKIGQYLHEQVTETPGMELTYVHSRSEPTFVVDDQPAVVGEEPLSTTAVDLVVEAATAEVLEAHGPAILEHSDLYVLSTTALADPDLLEAIRETARTHQTQVYVPHAAVLGLDGLHHAQAALETVHIETRKNPANIDFSAASIDPETDIEGVTKLYRGPTRALCTAYPRNVNSHATIALAGVGFDETTSVLLADPETETATHTITADGPGTTLEITRETRISGVTGAYTVSSIWGSIETLLSDNTGLTIV